MCSTLEDVRHAMAATRTRDRQGFLISLRGGRGLCKSDALLGGRLLNAESVLVGSSASTGSSVSDWAAVADPGLQIGADRSRHGLAPVKELMRREQRYRVLLALADALAVLLALALLPLALGTNPNSLAFAAPILLVAVSKIQGLYDRDDRVVRKSTLAEWRTILQAAVVVSLAVAVSWRLAPADHGNKGLWLFLFVSSVTAGSMILGRTAARKIAQATSPTDRCLVIGRLDSADELVPLLSGLKGVELVGEIPGMPDGWSKADLEHVVLKHHAHRLVLVPDSEVSGSGMVQLIRAGKEIGVRMSIFPTVLASIGRSTTFDEVNGFPLLGVAPFGLSRSSRGVKRGLDIFVAGALLLLLSPVMALLAAWIKFDSPGPVLFRQVRVGRNGRLFWMFKFRSMVVDAESRKSELLAQNEAGGGLFKIALDPRITRVGRRLRRAHLDELPQLLNVLRGEMSLVGPRPLIQEEDALFLGGDRCRLWLTPGMTGPWQIRGPMTASLPEMAKLDYLYISNWSLWRDVDILVKTATGIIKRKGY